MRGKILAVGVLAALLTLAAVGGNMAIASSSGGGDTSRGSVEAPEREHENDAREDRSLKERSSISLADAEQAATDAQPGEVTKVEIEEEEGFIVYKVEVAGAGGAEHELEVDAGNGDILDSETDYDDDRGDRDDDDWDDDGDKGGDD